MRAVLPDEALTASPSWHAMRPQPVRPPSDLSPTSDFSPIAGRYDATRDVPPGLLDAAYDRMIAADLLPAAGTILDAGCGTGQMSLPLAARGYAIEGFDISGPMVALAQAKCRPGWPARYRQADVRALPLPDGAVDAVVVSKLFQHVSGWQDACRELLRVLKPGGALIHLADRGAFGNPVRRYFAAMAEGMGFVDRFPGMQRRADLVAFARSTGAAVAALDLTDLRWAKDVCYGDAWDQIRDRLFAEFWYLPDSAYAQILADTADWIEALPDGRDTVARMTPWLDADIFRR